MGTPVHNGIAASNQWTAQQKAGRKRTIPAPTLDAYTDWTTDQRKLELLLENQRLDKHGRGATEINSERRSKHCPYRLLNVVFSEEFFDKFITSGDTLTRAELDDGRRVFCDNVAEAFNTSNAVFDRLLSEDSLFEEGRCKLSGSHAQFWNYCQAFLNGASGVECNVYALSPII
ncbi:hypothetical protein PC119_g21209 [Phytophthora cactorum]|nr:hypothetical protein PC111_g18958 [Phytophthora cactorum]KAG2980672.1 hypothetical protein PC119_g21209 [Phytophthora cactorum]